MRVLVAIDSFKGSATSAEMNQAVRAGLLDASPSLEVETVAIADGGEGTLDALACALSGEMVQVQATDLLGRPLSVAYLVAQGRAFIESATLLGIDKITPSPEIFEKASSAGLADLVLDALERNCRQIFVTLGGTGSSDGGRGFLEKLIPYAEQLRQVELIGLTDVRNPYAGPEGYARIFGPQKGGTPEQIAVEDARAREFVHKIRAEKQMDLQKLAGSGAAGGLGGAILVLGGKLRPGFSSIVDLIGLEEKVAHSDLVITGEGRLDSQSFQGKAPVGLAELAQVYNRPVIALCGAVGERELALYSDFLAVFSIQTKAQSLENAMKESETLKNARFVAGNVWQLFSKSSTGI